MTENFIINEDSETKSIDEQIKKINKAITKAKNAASSDKAKIKPKIRKGAEKTIKELSKRKEELESLKNEIESANRELKSARTTVEQKKAEAKIKKAEKRFEKFMKAKEPINLVLKILGTLTGVAATSGLFIALSQMKSISDLASLVDDYFRNGGDSHEGYNSDVNDALVQLRHIFKNNFNPNQRYSIVTEETKDFFPY